MRKYEIAFAPLLFEAAIESRDESEFRRGMPWRHENYTIEESRESIEKVEQNRRNSEDIRRAGMEFGYAVFNREADFF